MAGLDLGPIIEEIIERTTERTVRETLRQIAAEKAESDGKLLVDRVEAGRLLGLTGAAIGFLERSGDLVSIRLGKSRKYRLADIQRLVEARSGDKVKRRA